MQGELQDVLRYLERRLVELARSSHAWQVEIHGKGRSVQVKVSEITQFQAERETLLEERRR
ncbi:hypothetical protein [Caldilinea sp.]|uniref:hypothetical protein n=1 Tax=Caldilinea sp. TaxID=2293560 RepID=UPI0021DBB0A9|nr:hypothetical protein [Caldilinea sp.]GIV73555.1 MAG: hypothetical protein KatS3mg049_2111 [Caldilinea sp.]